MKKFTRQEIESKVNEILVDKLGIDASEIRNDAQMEADLNADSLDAVELVMEFEHEFNICIKDEDMYAMTQWNVGNIYDLIEQLTA